MDVKLLNMLEKKILDLYVVNSKIKFRRAWMESKEKKENMKREVKGTGHLQISHLNVNKMKLNISGWK